LLFVAIQVKKSKAKVIVATHTHNRIQFIWRDSAQRLANVTSQPTVALTDVKQQAARSISSSFAWQWQSNVYSQHETVSNTEQQNINK